MSIYVSLFLIFVFTIVLRVIMKNFVNKEINAKLDMIMEIIFLSLLVVSWVMFMLGVR